MATKENTRLDRLLDDFAEWQKFPATQKGNRKDFDAERSRFEREIKQARAALAKAQS